MYVTKNLFQVIIKVITFLIKLVVEKCNELFAAKICQKAILSKRARHERGPKKVLG